MRRTGSILLILVALMFVPSCSMTGSRPLNYDEMTEQEKTDEAKLQQRLEKTAGTVAKIAFDLVPEGQRKDIANKVYTALKTIDGLLGAKTNKELIGKTLDGLQELVKGIGKDIRSVAQDALDLFSGWVDLPELNDLLPPVITDRLRAFIKGALAGLEPYRL